jgi:hypothetical protein
MTARRVLSLLWVAVCGATLVGCGGDTLSFDPVANAATKTASTTSSRVAFTATMDVDGVGGMTLSGAGLFDGRTKSGALNMRFALPADAQAQLGGVDPTMQMIFDGRHGLVMYMRSPLLRTLAADKWVKMDLAKVAKKAGIDLGSLMNANQADPSQSLKMLMASSDAHPLGFDRVRGVFTTHYTLKVDLARLAKDNKAMSKALDQVRKLTGVDSYPAEAWVDDQGRVRKLKVDMSFNSAAGGAFTMSLTEELYAFGVKADIQPPPASDVLDYSSLVNSGG